MLHSAALPDRAGFAVTLRGVLLLGIAACFAVLLVLAFTHSVNWDEYYFLSLVHAHAQERLDRPLQTFHVHLFEWLTAIPGDELTQITVARLVMLALLVGTASAVYRMGRSLAGETPALVAVLAFLTSGFVIAHGGSFRTDPIAACLLTGAVCLIITSPMRLPQILATAMACSLALLITIKAVLFLPAFVGAVLWRAESRGMIVRVFLAWALALVLAAALYLWHSAGVQPAPGREASSNALNALDKTILSTQFLPRGGYLAVWALLSIGALVLIAAGICAPMAVRRRAMLILLTLPIASVLVYRNAFPYFYPFIVPPLMVAAAVGAAQLRPSMLAALTSAMLGSGVIQGTLAVGDGATSQRLTIAEVHRLFPEPVPYIDRNGMVSSFPSVGFFMSSWGLENYRDAGVAVFERLIQEHAPPLVVANSRALESALSPSVAYPACCGLLPEDVTALRRTYVHHWGAIWLAGRDLILTGAPQEVDLMMAGPYRVEASMPILINGQSVQPWNTVLLEQGRQVVLGGRGGAVRLVWSTGETIPPQSPPNGSLYVPFW